MSTDINVFNPDKFALKRRSYGNIFIDPEIDVVPREEWGAQQPRDPGEDLGEDVAVVVATLNTDTPACDKRDDCERTVRAIQRSHLREGHADIQYNFLIGGDGRIYEGRGWYRKPCPFLAKPNNYPEGEERLDIAFIGDWRFSENPANEMLDPTMFFVMFGIRNKFISDKYRFFELDKRFEKPKKEESTLDDASSWD